MSQEDICDIVRQRIIDRIKIGPQNLSELHEAIPEAPDRLAIARICGALKRNGIIAKRDDDRYECALGIIAKPSAWTREKPPRDRCGQMKPIRPTVPEAPAPEASDDMPATDRAHQALQKLVADTQGALDEYVLSISDMDILTPLQAARDSARQALAALERASGAR